MASAVIPANMAIDSPPITVSVVAALRALGGRNAGTPLEMASAPVSAVQPEENARSASSIRASPVSPTCPAAARTCQSALSATGGCPNAVCSSPTAIIASTPTTNRYVGTANSRPDSRTPRRFIAVSSATKPRFTTTR